MIAPFTPFMIVPPPLLAQCSHVEAHNRVLPQLPINEMTDTELMVRDTDMVVTGEYEGPRGDMCLAPYMPRVSVLDYMRTMREHYVLASLLIWVIIAVPLFEMSRDR